MRTSSIPSSFLPVSFFSFARFDRDGVLVAACNARQMRAGFAGMGMSVTPEGERASITALWGSSYRRRNGRGRPVRNRSSSRHRTATPMPPSLRLQCLYPACPTLLLYFDVTIAPPRGHARHFASYGIEVRAAINLCYFLNA
jgi:hypothetical protein